MTSEQKYPGYEELTSYLTQSKDKSFWSFLLRCRDTIVATTPTTSRRKNLDNTWIQYFLTEAKELLNPNEFNNLSNKVCIFLLCKVRVTLGRLRSHSGPGELLGMSTWVTSLKSFIQVPYFVVGKGLLIPKEELVMCLPFGACRLSSDFSIL
jgi:hypothetical protein